MSPWVAAVSSELFTCNERKIVVVIPSDPPSSLRLNPTASTVLIYTRKSSFSVGRRSAFAGLCDDSSEDEAPAAEDDKSEEEQPEPPVQAQAKQPANSGAVRRCWKSHPGMPEDPSLHDGDSEDEPPALCEDDSSSDDDSVAEPIVEATPQPEPEAQAKPRAKRARPPMAKHTPVLTRGLKKAMHNFFGWEPIYDDESGFPTRKEHRRMMREMRLGRTPSQETPISASSGGYLSTRTYGKR